MPTLKELCTLDDAESLTHFQSVVDAFDRYMKPRYGEFWILESYKRFYPCPNTLIAEELQLPVSYIQLVRKAMIRAAKENLAEVQSQHESS